MGIPRMEVLDLRLGSRVRLELLVRSVRVRSVRVRSASARPVQVESVLAEPVGSGLSFVIAPKHPRAGQKEPTRGYSSDELCFANSVDSSSLNAHDLTLLVAWAFELLERHGKGAAQFHLRKFGVVDNR